MLCRNGGLKTVSFGHLTIKKTFLLGTILVQKLPLLSIFVRWSQNERAVILRISDRELVVKPRGKCRHSNYPPVVFVDPQW